VSVSGQYGYVLLKPVESFHLARLGLPLVAEGRRRHLGTRPHYGAGGERVCTAFDGAVGAACGCSIYADRPEICRHFEAGSAGCLEARRDAGLTDETGS
jgi:Fe-S-cluster containining protein